MTFASIPFLVFLSFILISEAWFRKNRYAYLAVVSLTFYALAGAELVVLLFISSAIVHLSVRKFETKNRKWWLILSISANLLFLVGVKIHYYLDFKLFQLENLIPLGISFYTLQSISYLVDVFNKKVSKIDCFIAYLAYISFLPQLIAGPIERCNKLYPQLINFGLANTQAALSASRLFVFGIYLKLVVSNRLSAPINNVAITSEYDIFFFLNGVLGFLYVYADFFAYTLMARGISAFFGINLNLNFNRPFRRKNLIAFWQSWHISLTKWMTDYVYIPLIKRVKVTWTSKLILSVISMILIGLWHGFGWNFVFFGLMHGTMMQLLPQIDRLVKASSLTLPTLNNRIGLILVMACSGNIFLHGTNEQLYKLITFEHFVFISSENFKAYLTTSFAIGLLGTLPLLFHEFSKESFLYREMSPKKELLLLGSLIGLTALFWKNGESHVYFAF